MKLNPMMWTALQAAARGALELTPAGWVSTIGLDGVWNSHTITWLAEVRGFLRVINNHATITPRGRVALQDDWRMSA